MGLINSLEHRFRWLAFPSLLRGLAIIHFSVILLLILRPMSGGVLTFNWEKILNGEVWRVFSFLFLPIGIPNEEIGYVYSPFTAVFAFFAMRIAFLCSDALEHAWGIWRTSAYFYAIMVGQIVANITLSLAGYHPESEGGFYIYMAAFFAFATLFPKHVFLLMFVIPVQIWILAALSGVLLIGQAIGSPSFAFFAVLTFFPYLWWVIPLAFKNRKRHTQIAKRRIEFQAKSKSSPTKTFHLCKQCGATEVSHPDRDFRVADDGQEICSDCIGT